MEMSAHVAEFPALVPAMMKTDILEMTNVVAGTMAAGVNLYSLAYVNDVSDDFVAFVVSLEFLVCDVADICSQDALSYAALYDSTKRNNINESIQLQKQKGK